MMMLLLLTTHFVGDFLLQSNWMAINKYKRWDALTLHAAVYTGAFLPLALLWGDSPQALHFLIVTFALHWLTDAVTSRVTSRLWFLDLEPCEANRWSKRRQRYQDSVFVHFDGSKRHWFFVVIGFDQLLHAYALWGAALWLMV